MRNWIIAETDVTNTHLIATEKALWISAQRKGVDINQLINSRNLGSVKSIRYQDLKEIFLIESDFTLQFKYKDDKENDEKLTLEKHLYIEIRSYLKSHLRGTKLKNYTLFKQITPRLITLGIAILLVVVTYLSAQEIENGGTITVTGSRVWFKKIIVTIAETLGTIGTLAVGIPIVGAITYFLIRKIQNPKKGQILKMTKATSLRT